MSYYNITSEIVIKSSSLQNWRSNQLY